MCRIVPLISEDLYKETINQVDNIVFTYHAEQRWNERVGPNASLFQLNELITDLKLLGRISFFEDFGVIDDEIVFHFAQDNDSPTTLVIQTLLGRISLKPLIREFEHIRNRYVYLDVPSEIIDEQHLPTISEHEREQLKEIKDQLRFNQMSVEERMTSFEKECINFYRTVTLQLKKAQRRKEIEEKKQLRLEQKALYKNKRSKYQEVLERVQIQKMKQRMNMKCSVYSSMVERDLTEVAQRSIDDKLKDMKVS